MSITVPLSDYIADAFTEPFTLIADTLTTPAAPIVASFLTHSISPPPPPSSSSSPSSCRVIFIHTANLFTHYTHILTKHGLSLSSIKQAIADKRLTCIDAFTIAATAYAQDDDDQTDYTQYAHKVWETLLSLLHGDEYRIIIDDVQPLLLPLSSAARLDFVNSLVSLQARHRLVIVTHSGIDDDVTLAMFMQFASFVIQLQSIHNNQLTTTTSDELTGAMTVARRDPVVGAICQPIPSSVHYKVSESGVTIYPKGALILRA